MAQDTEKEDFYGTGMNILLFICMCILLLITAFSLLIILISFISANLGYLIITILITYSAAFGSYILLRSAHGEYKLKFVKISMDVIKKEYPQFNAGIGKIILYFIAIIIVLFIIGKVMDFTALIVR